MEIQIRTMSIEDYEEIFTLWKTIKGFAIRSIDDSYKGIEKFLRRNPETSVVAVCEGKIIGTILCGHDGRCGYFYHVCVQAEFRKEKVGERMVAAAMDALRKEEICRINLVAFKKNQAGNRFWQSLGWNEREINYYDYILNQENTMEFNV